VVKLQRLDGKSKTKKKKKKQQKHNEELELNRFHTAVLSSWSLAWTPFSTGGNLLTVSLVASIQV
jgi:hypothetical protein